MNSPVSASRPIFLAITRNPCVSELNSPVGQKDCMAFYRCL
jgi:hypothetical protein